MPINSITRFFLVLLMAGLFSQGAAAGGWQPFTTVKGLIPQPLTGQPDGSGYFVELTSPTNPDACTNPSAVLIDGSTQLGKYLVAAMMLAKSSGATVSVNLAGCDLVSPGTPIVVGVWLR